MKILLNKTNKRFELFFKSLFFWKNQINKIDILIKYLIL